MSGGGGEIRLSSVPIGVVRGLTGSRPGSNRVGEICYPVEFLPTTTCVWDLFNN